MSNESEMLSHISEKIRKLRTDRKVTLKEMSAATGLSVSFLSQVERGTSSLAISSLEKIAEALGVPITDFFHPFQHRRFVTYQQEYQAVVSEQTQSIPIRLAGHFPDRKLEPFMVILQPNQKEWSNTNTLGEKFYFVLEGEVIFSFEGEDYHMKSGDAIHFPANTSYSRYNPLSTPTSVLYISTPLIF